MADVTKRFALDVQVLKLNEGQYVAVTNPGGIRVRGALMQDELNAVRNLLIVMGNANGEDELSDIALALAMGGTTIDAAAGPSPKELGGVAAGDSGGGGQPGD